MRKIAICLVSGGIDSCVTATYAKNQGYELYCLSINYGQTLDKELIHAKKIGKFLGTKKHKIIDLKDFKKLSQSAITGWYEIPKNRDFAKKEIPATYPPGRDPFFIILAAAWAESIWLQDVDGIEKVKIFIGTNKYDSSTYPDCKPEVYKKLNELLKISTKISTEFNRSIEIETPLINKNKSELIKFGVELKAPLHLTWSCYEGKEKACGKCDACKLRLQAFKEAKVKDPVEYD